MTQPTCETRADAVAWIESHNRRRDVQYPGAKTCRWFRTMWRVHHGRRWDNGRGANGTCTFATPDEAEAFQAYEIMKAHPDPYYYVNQPIPPNDCYVCAWCRDGRSKACKAHVKDPRTLLDKLREMLKPRYL